MIKLTIMEIGTPRTVQTKFGAKEKSYIKAAEYPDKFLNYWLGESTKSWDIGQTIEVESVEKNDYTAKDGSLKTSWDIKLPRSNFSEILKRIEALENAQTKTNIRVADLENKVTPKKEEPEYPPFENEPTF